MKTITTDEWITALEEASEAKAEVVPKDWLTRQDLEKVWNCSTSTAKDRLHLLMEKGKIEAKKYRIPNGNRGIHPVLHYRLKR